jgi:predicted small lipoprotein YifL
MKAPAILGTVVAVGLLAACGDRGPEQEPPAAEPPATTEPASGSTAEGTPCPDPPPCGDDCSNHPFAPTECWTTPYGPAKADVIIGNPLTSPNMLYCDAGAYALCFFSGPPEPTGKRDAGNPPLPCVLEAGGDVAKCTCEVFTSGPYFVDINAILNLGAYFETVQACGQDGSRCANMHNCGRDGTKPGCEERKRAPVCQYVADQDPDDPAVSLMPKADLVSTFSFAMNDDYLMGSSDCNSTPPAKYAGCMTAPCFFAEGDDSPPEDGETIQCHCPTYTGEFQIGQPHREHQCTIGEGKTHVWSAARSVMDGGGQ